MNRAADARRYRFGAVNRPKSGAPFGGARIALLKTCALSLGRTPSRMRWTRPCTSDQAASAAASTPSPCGARFDAAAQHDERLVRGFPQFRIGLALGDQRREHQPEHAGARQREIDIGRAHRRQRLALAPSLSQRRGEFAEALGGDGGEQIVLVAKMPIGRRRRDADAARRLAQAHRVGAALVEQRTRRGDQGRAEMAVMVGRSIRC